MLYYIICYIMQQYIALSQRDSTTASMGRQLAKIS